MVTANLSMADTPGYDLEALRRIRDESGPEAITVEETAALDAIDNPPLAPDSDHYVNLAEYLDDRQLRDIAADVVKWVQWDEDSREDWREMEKSGIRALGVTPNVDGGASFKGASTAVHPVLAEACVQFQSRALENFWPAGGPVKTAVLGAIDEQRQEQASRVEQFLNYQYTELMPGSFEQVDQMLLRLPLSGSCFVKVFPEPNGLVARRFIEPVDFLVPYRSTDLETAPRYTERVLLSKNELRKQQVSGFYRDIELAAPREDSDADRDVVIDEVDAAEGHSETSIQYDDDRHTLYECYCELDLPGYEDEAYGEQTGVALPYVVTVDKDTQDTLSIRRNWKENDEEKKRVIYHIHYRFTPGLGFYGYGLYHWIGSLARSATGSLRALLDSGHLANIPGGYRSRMARIEGGDKSFSPGVFQEVDATSEDLKKAFFQLPFKEPSNVLFSLMGHLEEMSRRFTGTTDVMVGEGNSNVPVGTTLARIEQGTKVTSAIQKRLHEAARREYRLIAWLDSIHLPQHYPYIVEGEDREVMRQDFDDRVDVLPVSDPQFVSNSQRHFVSEASLEIAARNPELYDLHELHRRAQSALRIDDLETLLPAPDDLVKRMGPIEENAAALQGLPVKSHLEQHHAAHIEVHTLFMQGMEEEQRNRIGALMQSHIQEHVSQNYLLQMQMMTGVMYQIPSKQALKEEWQEIPIEYENEIAIRAAMTMRQAMQAMPQEQPVDPDAEEQRRKDAVAQADIQRKDTATLADIERKNATAEADINRKATITMNDEIAKQAQRNRGEILG